MIIFIHHLLYYTYTYKLIVIVMRIIIYSKIVMFKDFTVTSDYVATKIIIWNSK